MLCFTAHTTKEGWHLYELTSLKSIKATSFCGTGPHHTNTKHKLTEYHILLSILEENLYLLPSPLSQPDKKRYAPMHLQLGIHSETYTLLSCTSTKWENEQEPGHTHSFRQAFAFSPSLLVTQFPYSTKKLECFQSLKIMSFLTTHLYLSFQQNKQK